MDATIGRDDAYGYDVAFQRDEDRSLQVNLGFMAIRCSRAVADLFRVAGEVIAQKRPGSTGDQRIVNRALAEPWFYGTPRLRWTVFPAELCTDTVADARGPRRSFPWHVRVAAATRLSAACPRRGCGGAATRLRRLCTLWPRRRRDSSPQNSHEAVAASPRLVSAECPRRGRGGAATRLRGM